MRSPRNSRRKLPREAPAGSSRGKLPREAPAGSFRGKLPREAPVGNSRGGLGGKLPREALIISPTISRPDNVLKTPPDNFLKTPRRFHRRFPRQFPRQFCVGEKNLFLYQKNRQRNRHRFSSGKSSRRFPSRNWGLRRVVGGGFTIGDLPNTS